MRYLQNKSLTLLNLKRLRGMLLGRARIAASVKREREAENLGGRERKREIL